MKRIIYLSLLCLAVLLTGCAGNQATSTEAPEIETTTDISEYLIGPGDTLQINVWRNDELSVNVPVRPDGKISMPLIGDVDVAGLTTDTLSKNIAQSLLTYIRSPQVTVIVTNPGSSDYARRVRITGAINAPLSVPFRRDMTVLDLVLEAGGLTEFASGNRAKLYRRIDGEVKVFPVRLNDMLQRGKLDTNYKLAPADIITVPESLF